MTSSPQLDPALQAHGLAAELIATVDALVEHLRDLRVPQIPRGTPSLVAKIPFKVLVYRQVMTYRACDLAEAYVREANARAFIPCFLLSRALFEGACALYDLALRIDALVASDATKDVEAFDTHVMALMHGTKSSNWRALGASLQSVNVLTLVDRVAKKVGTYVTEAYEDLSEFCHPNAAGAATSFAPPELAEPAAVFVASPALSDSTGVAWHIRATNVALYLHLQAAAMIQSSSPSLVSLCERAIHKAGTWPASVPYPSQSRGQGGA